MSSSSELADQICDQLRGKRMEGLEPHSPPQAPYAWKELAAMQAAQSQPALGRKATLGDGNTDLRSVKALAQRAESKTIDERL